MFIYKLSSIYSMEILKIKQEIYYNTQLSEQEISERLNNLLDTKQQNPPDVFGGTYKQNRLELYSVNAGLWITPKVLGTISNGQILLKLEPSKRFKIANFLMAFITVMLGVRIAQDFESYWYYLLLFILFDLTLVNFEGLKNYRNILRTLERILELTKGKEDNMA